MQFCKSIFIAACIMLTAYSSLLAQRIFYSGFEDATEPFPPPGWAVTHTGNANWQSLLAYIGGGNQYEGHYCMYLANSFYNDQSDAWLISPEFIIEAGKKYSISFYYKNQQYVNNTLEVTLGADTTPASQTEIIWTKKSPDNIYAKGQINYTATQTRTLHIGFHATTPKTFTYMYIDNVLIEEVNCFEPLNPTLVATDLNNAKLKWNAPSDALGYEYGVSDTLVRPTDIKRTDNTGTKLRNLEAAKRYYFYVRSRCTETQPSAWAVKEFSTIYDASAFDTLQCGVRFNNNFTATLGLYLSPLCNDIYFGKEFFHKFVAGAAGEYTLHVYSVNVGQTMAFLYKDAALGAGPDGWTCIGSANDFGGKFKFGPLEAGKEYIIMEKARTAPGFPSSYKYGIDCLEPLATASTETNDAVAKPGYKISVSPNPFTASFVIHVNESKACKYSISIITVDGQIVNNLNKEISAGKTQVSIAADNLKPGMYILKIDTPSGTQYQKIVKQ